MEGVVCVLGLNGAPEFGGCESVLTAAHNRMIIEY